MKKSFFNALKAFKSLFLRTTLLIWGTTLIGAQAIYETDLDDSEGYLVGILNPQNDLATSELFSLDDISTPYAGMQFIWLPANFSGIDNELALSSNSLSASAPIYIDFYTFPGIVASFSELPEISDYPIAAITGLVNAHDGFAECAIVHGDGSGGGVWQFTSSYIELEGNILAEDLWYVYKLDIVEKRYDLYINGVLIVQDVPFIDRSSIRLAQLGNDKNGQQENQFGHINISHDMPTGLDYNNDLIEKVIDYSNHSEAGNPDETKLIFSDADRTSESSEEIKRYSFALMEAERNLYVDCILGNDSYDGLCAQPSGLKSTCGPKASISSAFDAARDSDRIQLQACTYNESILDMKGKNLTLYLNGPVTIN